MNGNEWRGTHGSDLEEGFGAGGQAGWIEAGAAGPGQGIY